jgi:hypothetical protein
MFQALFGYISDLEIIVPFDSEDVAICFRRDGLEVTNFSTRGGYTTTTTYE